MGIKDKIKKLLRIVVPEPKQDITHNINALGVARVTDIKSILSSLKIIKQVIDTIPDFNNYYTKSQTYNRDEIDASLSQVAKVNIKNNFVNQAIKGNTAFLEFRKQNNDRKGYIGIEENTSQDIHLRAETNSLFLRAQHDIHITPVRNAIYNKQPVEDNHITNKKYVDDKFASIPQPDLSNVAKLDTPNNFTNANVFGNHLPKSYDDSGNALIPQFPVDLVTKKYVDDKVFIPLYTSKSFSERKSISKYAFMGGYKYRFGLTLELGSNIGTFLVIAKPLSIYSGNKDRYANYSNGFSTQQNTQIIYRNFGRVNIDCEFMSSTDLNVGGSTHTGEVNVDVTIIRLI